MNLDHVRGYREQREGVRAEFGPFFGEVASILFRLDPILINYGVNPDEYEAEVGTILPRLQHVSSEAAALDVIHEEFVRWFGEKIAGPRERYVGVAAEIWTAWLGWKSRDATPTRPDPDE